jgi:hypothetical protein
MTDDYTSDLIDMIEKKDFFLNAQRRVGAVQVESSRPIS